MNPMLKEKSKIRNFGQIFTYLYIFLQTFTYLVKFISLQLAPVCPSLFQLQNTWALGICQY